MSTQSVNSDTKKVVEEQMKLIASTLSGQKLDTINLVEQEKSDKIESSTTSNVANREQEFLKPDIDTKPEKPAIPAFARKDEIARALLRFPLLKRTKPVTSTFAPTTFTYFEVIHTMDSLMSDNLYFLNTGVTWHPLISRIYFSILIYLQVFRAMDYAKVGKSFDRLSIARVLQDLPPERLPIPGPLVPMMKSICASQPEDDFFGLVTPEIVPEALPLQYTDLIPQLASMYMMPNIPILVELLNMIIDAPEDEIPDFSSQSTIQLGQPFNINGHDFPEDMWTSTERTALLQPGMIYPTESTKEMDEEMNRFGTDLGLPDIEPVDQSNGLLEYTLLEDTAWVDRLIPIMSTYCSFFKDSSNLGACSPYGPQTGLIRARPERFTGRNLADNEINTLENGFPGTHPFLFEYDFRSYEYSIPQMIQSMGQLSAINTSIEKRGLENWSYINSTGPGRTGPYWSQNPTNLERSQVKGLMATKAIVADYYFIENPGNKL